MIEFAKKNWVILLIIFVIGYYVTVVMPEQKVDKKLTEEINQARAASNGEPITFNPAPYADALSADLLGSYWSSIPPYKNAMELSDKELISVAEYWKDNLRSKHGNKTLNQTMKAATWGYWSVDYPQMLMNRLDKLKLS